MLGHLRTNILPTGIATVSVYFFLVQKDSRRQFILIEADSSKDRLSHKSRSRTAPENAEVLGSLEGAEIVGALTENNENSCSVTSPFKLRESHSIEFIQTHTA